MIAVIFEAIPAEGMTQAYLDMAARLKPQLAAIPGFIAIERFQSLSNPEKVLSLSFWEDEDAIRQWRTLELHRAAQAAGRSCIFKDYELKVAGVVRAYSMGDRGEAPADSKIHHGKNNEI